MIPSASKRLVHPTRTASASSSNMIVSLCRGFKRATCCSVTTWEKKEGTLPYWSSNTPPMPPTPFSRQASVYKWKILPWSELTLLGPPSTIRSLRKDRLSTSSGSIDEWPTAYSHLPSCCICNPAILPKIWASAKTNLPLSTLISAADRVCCERMWSIVATSSLTLASKLHTVKTPMSDSLKSIWTPRIRATASKSAPFSNDTSQPRSWNKTLCARSMCLRSCSEAIRYKSSKKTVQCKLKRATPINQSA